MNEKRNPAGANGGASKSTNGRDLVVHPTGIELSAGDPETVALKAVLDQCAELGLVVGRRCRVCKHPLTARRSVLAGVGPRCAGGHA